MREGIQEVILKFLAQVIRKTELLSREKRKAILKEQG